MTEYQEAIRVAGQPLHGDILVIGGKRYVVGRSLLHAADAHGQRTTGETGWGTIQRVTKAGVPTGREIEVSFHGAGQIALPISRGRRLSQTYHRVNGRGAKRSAAARRSVRQKRSPSSWAPSRSWFVYFRDADGNRDLYVELPSKAAAEAWARMAVGEDGCEVERITQAKPNPRKRNPAKVPVHVMGSRGQREGDPRGYDVVEHQDRAYIRKDGSTIGYVHLVGWSDGKRPEWSPSIPRARDGAIKLPKGVIKEALRSIGWKP